MVTNYDRRSLISPGNEHGTSTSPRKMFRKMKATVSDSICGSKGSARDARSPLGPFFFNFRQFSGNNGQNNRSAVLSFGLAFPGNHRSATGEIVFFFNTVSKQRVVSEMNYFYS